MQAIYDSKNGDILREVIRDIPTVDVSEQMVRMFQQGAREVSVRPEPADQFGAATNGPEPVDRRDQRDWERLNWERTRKKNGVMVGGRKRR